MTEAAVKTVGFKENERNVFFHILTACNLSCAHCYINTAEHGNECVSRQTMDKWLRLFYTPDARTNLVFLGGEPTMHPDLVHGIRRARKIGYDSITVDTNGYLFHEFLDKVTPEEVVLSFSLDGPNPEVNDPIRGSGSFDTCLQNLKKAVARGFRVSVIYTVSRKNLEYLEKMVPLLSGSGVARFFIQVIGIRGKSTRDRDNLQLLPEEWLRTVPEVAGKMAESGIPTIYPKVFLEPNEGFECAGNVADNYFIFPNGRVYRCPLCEDFPFNTYMIEEGRLVKKEGITEEKLFGLTIPEGCVMNRILQEGNIVYDENKLPSYRISCCLLKQEITPPNHPE